MKIKEVVGLLMLIRKYLLQDISLYKRVTLPLLHSVVENNKKYFHARVKDVGYSKKDKILNDYLYYWESAKKDLKDGIKKYKEKRVTLKYVNSCIAQGSLISNPQKYCGQCLAYTTDEDNKGNITDFHHDRNKEKGFCAVKDLFHTVSKNTLACDKYIYDGEDNE